MYIYVYIICIYLFMYVMAWGNKKKPAKFADGPKSPTPACKTLQPTTQSKPESSVHIYIYIYIYAHTHTHTCLCIAPSYPSRASQHHPDKLIRKPRPRKAVPC